MLAWDASQIEKKSVLKLDQNVIHLKFISSEDSKIEVVPIMLGHAVKSGDWFWFAFAIALTTSVHTAKQDKHLSKRCVVYYF